MTTRELIQAGKYDYSSNQIKCVADAVRFAHIFEFRRAGQIITILAFDSIEAMEIFSAIKHPW